MVRIDEETGPALPENWNVHAGGVAIELHRGNVGGGVYLDISNSANYPLNYTGGLLVILSLIWTISELHSRCIGHIDTHLDYKWTTEVVKWSSFSVKTATLQIMGCQLV